MDSNVNSETLENWVKMLHLKKEADFLAKLENEGVQCLEHLKDIDRDDFDKDYHDWHLTKTEKNRFKRDLCTLAEQKGWSVIKKVQCQHEAARRETKRKYMSSYRSNMSKEQKERIKQKDREGKRQKKNQNGPGGPDGDRDGHRGKDGDGHRDGDVHRGRDGDGDRAEGRGVGGDSNFPTTTHDDTQHTPDSLMPNHPEGRSGNMLTERMIDQKFLTFKYEILTGLKAEFSEGLRMITNKLEEAEVDRKRLQEELKMMLPVNKNRSIEIVREDPPVNQIGGFQGGEDEISISISGDSNIRIPTREPSVISMSEAENLQCTQCQDDNPSCNPTQMTFDERAVPIVMEDGSKKTVPNITECYQDSNSTASGRTGLESSAVTETAYSCVSTGKDRLVSETTQVPETSKSRGYQYESDLSSSFEVVKDMLRNTLYTSPCTRKWCEDPESTEGDITCCENAKMRCQLIWRVKLDTSVYVYGADTMPNGDIICCTSEGPKMLSSLGVPKAMPYDTFFGGVEHISIKKEAGDVAILRQTPPAMIVIMNESGKWLQTMEHIKIGSRLESITWNSKGNVFLGVSTRRDFEPTLFKIVEYSVNPIKYIRQILVDNPPTFIEEYGEYLHLSCSSNIFLIQKGTKVVRTKFKDSDHIPNVCGFCLDRYGNIFVAHCHVSDKNKYTVSLWSRHGNYVQECFVLSNRPHGIRLHEVESTCYLIIWDVKQIVAMKMDKSDLNLLSKME